MLKLIKLIEVVNWDTIDTLKEVIFNFIYPLFFTV